MVEAASKSFIAWTKQHGIYEVAAGWLGGVDPLLYWSAVICVALLMLLLLRRSIVSQRALKHGNFFGAASGEKIDRIEALVYDLRSQHSETLHKLNGEVLYLRQELENLRRALEQSEHRVQGGDPLDLPDPRE